MSTKRHISAAILAMTVLAAAPIVRAADEPKAGTPANAPAPSQQPKPAAKPSIFDRPAMPTPPPLVGLDLNEKLGDTLPLSVEFTDHTGKKVTLGSVFNQGKPVIVQLVYFRCTLMCRQAMNGLSESIGQMTGLLPGKDYNVVVISFDPTDTPKAASLERQLLIGSYPTELTPEQEKQGFNVFTSANAAASRAVADALGFPYRYVAESNEYAHTTALMVISPEGKVCRYLYGHRIAAQSLRLSLVEAAQGTIGSTVDRFLLWCLHWNPSANSYSMSAMTAMKFGAALVGVVLVAVLTGFWIGEARRRRRRLAAAAGVLAHGPVGTGPNQIKNDHSHHLPAGSAT